MVTPGVEKTVSLDELPYVPARRHPVCPERNELSSLWTVR